MAWDVRIRPDLGKMYAWYGARLHRRARYHDALRAYERALVLAPARPGRYYTLGAARFSYGAPAYLKWTRRRVRALRARLEATP